MAVPKQLLNDCLPSRLPLPCRVAGAADCAILRPTLREEARTAVGDTGLLDHLLKHMVGGRVVP